MSISISGTISMSPKSSTITSLVSNISSTISIVSVSYPFNAIKLHIYIMCTRVCARVYVHACMCVHVWACMYVRACVLDSNRRFLALG